MTKIFPPIPIPVPKPKTSIPVPVQLDDTIDDVNTATQQFLRKHYGKPFAFAAIIYIIVLVVYAWYWLKTGIVPFGPQGLVLPIIIAILPSILVYNRFRHAFYRQFAELNGFGYQESGWLENLHGSLFETGTERSMEDIISGSLHGLPMTLTNFSYTIGSGKTRKKHQRTAVEIDYNSPLPSVLLQADMAYFGGMKPNFVYKERVQLEQTTEAVFNLYTERKFEIEALQIFTPELLDKLGGNWPSYSIELQHDSIYLYAPKLVANRKELEEMFTLAQYLAFELAPVIGRMKSGVKAMNEAFADKGI